MEIIIKKKRLLWSVMINVLIEIIVIRRGIYSSSCTTVVFSDTYNPSKNFLISLFLTVVDCWIRAAETKVYDVHKVF